MLKKWQANLLTALAVVALVLVIVNGTLVVTNQDTQRLVNERQQFIQQTVQLEGLYRDIVRSLAELAVKENDVRIIQMLAAQGINVSVNTPPAATTFQPAPTPALKR